MADHPYPQHMPKDSDDPGIKAAWDILDPITPGLLQPLVRFHIAGKIAREFRDNKAVVDAALELYDYLAALPLSDLHAIEQIMDLPTKLMKFQIAISKTRKEPT